MKTKAVAIPAMLLLLVLLSNYAQASNGNGRLKKLHAKFRHLFGLKAESKSSPAGDTLYVLGPKTENKVGSGVVIQCAAKTGMCATIYTRFYETGGNVAMPVVQEHGDNGEVVQTYYPRTVDVVPMQQGGMNIVMTFNQ